MNLGPVRHDHEGAAVGSMFASDTFGIEVFVIAFLTHQICAHSFEATFHQTCLTFGTSETPRMVHITREFHFLVTLAHRLKRTLPNWSTTFSASPRFVTKPRRFNRDGKDLTLKQPSPIIVGVEHLRDVTISSPQPILRFYYYIVSFISINKI